MPQANIQRKAQLPTSAFTNIFETPTLPKSTTSSTRPSTGVSTKKAEVLDPLPPIGSKGPDAEPKTDTTVAFDVDTKSPSNDAGPSKSASTDRSKKQRGEVLSLSDTESKWSKYSQRVRERTYDVNLITTHMPIYEPLLDEYLQDYFSSPNTRKHLLRLGLIDKDGRIIDAKTFKYNQIYLDKNQYENNVLKSQEERELDRDIEVAIRRQILEDTNPRSQKMKRMKKPGLEPRNTMPYPEFLSQYPVTMWKTALLYSEKPAPLMSAEQMLLERLRAQSARKLNALGLTPQMLFMKPPKEDSRPDSLENEKTSDVAHDDLSDPENFPVRVKSTKKGSGKGKEKARRHQNEKSTFSIAIQTAIAEYEAGNVDSALDRVKDIYSTMRGTCDEGQSEPEASPETVDKLILQSGLELRRSEKFLLYNIQKLGGNVQDVLDHIEARKSSYATPKSRFGSKTAAPQQKVEDGTEQTASSKNLSADRPTRPKSARPTRNSAFPVASDFSDFGSDCGAESDTELLSLIGDEAGVNFGATIENVRASNEPIAETIEDDENTKSMSMQSTEPVPFTQTQNLDTTSK
ncbi:hypothetical protein HDU97_000693 [Phlyctochytrium planicorne]|nr:hypothetical protein HDU97_000693 [Phlyctochytrium planicorne]